MNDERIRESVRMMLTETGEDPAREGLVRTPERVAKAMRFMTSGYGMDVKTVVNEAIFTVDYLSLIHI